MAHCFIIDNFAHCRHRLFRAPRKIYSGGRNSVCIPRSSSSFFMPIFVSRPASSIIWRSASSIAVSITISVVTPTVAISIVMPRPASIITSTWFWAVWGSRISSLCGNFGAFFFDLGRFAVAVFRSWSFHFTRFVENFFEFRNFCANSGVTHMLFSH